VWRGAFIKTERQQNESYRLYQTLRYGYSTAPSYDEARVLTDERAQSNTQNVNGVSGTTSAVQYRLFTAIFPNVAPTAAQTFMQALVTSPVTNPVIRGETITGTYRVLAVAKKEEEDGVNSVIVRYADAQYTIHQYQDFGVSEQSEEWELWNVPLEITQSIIDGFHAAYPLRSSSGCRRREEEKVCEITLRLKSARPDLFTEILTHDSVLYSEYTWYYFGIDNPQAYPCPAGGVGWVYDRSLSRGPGGTWNVVITKRVSKEYVIEDMPIGGNIFMQHFLSLRRNVARANYPAQTGVDREASASIAEDGKCEVSERRGVPQRVEEPEIVTEIDDFSQVTRKRVFNDGSYPALSAVPGKSSLSPELTGEGFWNWTQLTEAARTDLLSKVMTYTLNGEVEYEQSSETHFISWGTYYASEADLNSGTTTNTYGLSSRLRGIRCFRWQHVHTIRYFQTEDAAVAFLNDSVLPAGNVRTSGEHGRVLPGLWRVQKTVSTKNVIWEVNV